MAEIVLDKYRGPGLHYEDGRLGLACWRDVEAFAKYLGKSARLYAAGSAWYYRLEWQKDDRNAFILVINSLGMDKENQDRPCERGTLKPTSPPFLKRVYKGKVRLRNAGNRLLWYYRRGLRTQQRLYECAVSRTREEKRKMLQAKIEKFNRAIDQVEQEASRLLQLMKNSDKLHWQQGDETEVVNGEEPGGGST